MSPIYHDAPSGQCYSEGTAILPVLWHFPSMAVNATPQGPVSHSVNSTFLTFTWPLSKSQLQRVQSTGICLCKVSFLLKHYLSGVFIWETVEFLYKNILSISSHLRNSAVQGYDQILTLEIT